ncbi:MAG: HEPN domain-containing protein [Methanobrevibacter sp.]|nr:HEPN domain-containing protein [Candidatus Methanovirga meridionalis]
MDNHAVLLFDESEKTFEVAKLLFENGYYGDSINRVYYAMFYAAKALLAKKNIFPKIHKGTVNMFSKEFVKTSIIKIEIF